jgi:hypothetical protein
VHDLKDALPFDRESLEIIRRNYGLTFAESRVALLIAETAADVRPGGCFRGGSAAA